MSQEIRSVAVIGCGVIGSSWAALFLANGLRVFISEPAEGAEEAFRKYLDSAWPSLKASVAACEDKFAANYEFVADVASCLPKVDYVQEVC